MRHEREPLLDPGIRGAVLAMREAGLDTFTSCEGGEGHAFPKPVVRWRGPEGSQHAAAKAARGAGFATAEIRQVWRLGVDDALGRPFWEIIFHWRDPKTWGSA